MSQPTLSESHAVEIARDESLPLHVRLFAVAVVDRAHNLEEECKDVYEQEDLDAFMDLTN